MALLLLLGTAISCKKENRPQQTRQEQKDNFKEKTILQSSFAKTLAKAVEHDENLRAFLKEQSLKQFDNDHDILYQLVKDVEINGETFHQKLLRFTNVEKLQEIESKLPLLTIFIPTVPNFNPNTWNTANESPVIAVTNDNHSISLYNKNGEELRLNLNEVPSFPVLVIKDNERVLVNSRLNKLSTTKEMLSTIGVNKSNTSFSYSFIADTFNGSFRAEQLSNVLKSNKLNTIRGSVGRVAPSPNLGNPNAIDQVNVDAYNSGSEWHRDYVYYGITPTNPNGAFKNNYSEFITSFKFLSGDNLGIIADQDGDPKANKGYRTRAGVVTGWGSEPRTMWTDGKFEIRITILINAKNGLGNEVTKMMDVNGSDLFELQYETIIDNNSWGKILGLKSIIPKEYHPNIEILPWDLENYGTAWKFIFYEIDPAQEVTNTYENTTTYATNFGFDAQIGKSKVGPKFGFTATTSEKKSFSVKTTLTSDFLGEATLTFDQPVIIGYSNGVYNTREITTGNNISISVEPRKVF